MAMIPAVMSRTNLWLNIKEHRTTSTEAAQVPSLMKVTSILALSVIRTLKKLCLCNLCKKYYIVPDSICHIWFSWLVPYLKTHLVQSAFALLWEVRCMCVTNLGLILQIYLSHDTIAILIFSRHFSEDWCCHRVAKWTAQSRLRLAVVSLRVFVFPENTISLPAPRNTPCTQHATVRHCGNPAVWW